MSEIVIKQGEQKKSLRNLLLRIHGGEDPQVLRGALAGILQHIPYDVVVGVEQLLLAEGMPVEEIQSFFDLHSQVLNGPIEAPSPELEIGHPAQVQMKENEAFLALTAPWKSWVASPAAATPEEEKNLRLQWPLLMDEDKHYRRKESRAPFLIQKGPRFIHSEYFALRSAGGTYLGCLEVSLDLTEKRALQGQQRLLAYGNGK